MPPKVKIGRDFIVNAVFEVARNERLAAITAQSVSAVLNTSAASIFREFQTIEELCDAASEKIKEFWRLGLRCRLSAYAPFHIWSDSNVYHPSHLLLKVYDSEQGEWSGMKWFFMDALLHLAVCGLIRIAL